MGPPTGPMIKSSSSAHQQRSQLSSAPPVAPESVALIRPSAGPELLLTRRSLLLATTLSSTIATSTLIDSRRLARAAPAPDATLTPPVAVAVPRGASPSEALREALVGRGLDCVALVLEPGVTYDLGVGLVIDLESRPFGAPPPSVSILVGNGSNGNKATTLRLDTKMPYARVLEARGDGVVLRAEGLHIVHSSKSVASNYACLVSAGASLELAACEVASSTGAGVCADGAASCSLADCSLVGNARQGLAAFGGSRDTSSLGPAVVRLDSCRVERNGGDGVIVRDGAALLLRGACILGGNSGAAVRWFVLEEREADAALAVAQAGGSLDPLIGLGVRFERGGGAKGAVVVDTGGGAGDPQAADALAAALKRGDGGASAAVEVV